MFSRACLDLSVTPEQTRQDSLAGRWRPGLPRFLFALRTDTVICPPTASDWLIGPVPLEKLEYILQLYLDSLAECCTAGVRWCGNRRASHLLHLTWGLLYSLAGGVQFTAGIYFMMALPIFQLGSNIWTGAWVSRS